ncbi:hypothetical protein [Gaetbulibacter saemankumensis]|uniref:hypothetical protein n=1 Tax=Gaetbulibacter saemankumensis TaxID=311208 RepID=UPI000418B44B|nr:hypothetical protein [Gaetbulibacter saemankumensis]
MKLIIVTAVEAFEEEVLTLFKKANIDSFSGFDIEGYKNIAPIVKASNWFSGKSKGNESIMFFSFTDAEKIDPLFNLITEFNNNLETDNPIRGIVLPIEKFI